MQQRKFGSVPLRSASCSIFQNVLFCMYVQDIYSPLKPVQTLYVQTMLSQVYQYGKCHHMRPTLHIHMPSTSAMRKGRIFRRSAHSRFYSSRLRAQRVLGVGLFPPPLHFLHRGGLSFSSTTPHVKGTSVQWASLGFFSSMGVHMQAVSIAVLHPLHGRVFRSQKPQSWGMTMKCI